VEQFYRDNRLNPIHEGTDGIQAIDLLGRKVVINDGAGLRLLVETITATIDSAPASLGSMGEELRVALDRIVSVTEKLWSDGDPVRALANATMYADAVGHVVVAWIWLSQMSAADGCQGPFYEGKRAAGQFFFRYELPKTGPMLDLLEERDTLLLDISDDWL